MLLSLKARAPSLPSEITTTSIPSSHKSFPYFMKSSSLSRVFPASSFNSSLLGLIR